MIGEVVSKILEWGDKSKSVGVALLVLALVTGLVALQFLWFQSVFNWAAMSVGGYTLKLTYYQAIMLYLAINTATGTSKVPPK